MYYPNNHLGYQSSNLKHLINQSPNFDYLYAQDCDETPPLKMEKGASSVNDYYKFTVQALTQFHHYHEYLTLQQDLENKQGIMCSFTEKIDLLQLEYIIQNVYSTKLSVRRRLNILINDLMAYKVDVCYKPLQLSYTLYFHGNNLYIYPEFASCDVIPILFITEHLANMILSIIHTQFKIVGIKSTPNINFQDVFS